MTKINNYDLQKPEFWESIWKECVKITRPDEKVKSPEFWSSKVGSFPDPLDKNTDIYLRAMDEIKFLQYNGALNHNYKVLDIGCGTGTHAVHFARMINHLTALDLSSDMINKLNETIDKNSITNIKTINKDWSDFDIDKNHFTKSFNLVFASQSPATSEVSNLNKMMTASRKWCCVIIWFTASEFPLLYDMWQNIYPKKQFVPYYFDAYYIYNWLCASGYLPLIKTYPSSKSRKRSVDDVLSSYIQSLKIYGHDFDEKILNNARKLITKHTDNDEKVAQPWKNNVGLILWDVNSRAY